MSGTGDGSRRNRRVVVVGAGGAGLAAALEAAQAGAEVTVLDAADQVGGATARAGGVVYAADTETQAKAGLTDSLDELYAYYMTITHYRLEPRLVRASVAGGRDAVDWLTGLGVEFDPARLYVAGVETVPRGHMAGGETGGLGPAGGAAIVHALHRAARRAGVTVRTGVRVSGLTSADGAYRVVGGAERWDADAVVLATGGFGASPQMCGRYYPDATEHGDWHWYIGPDTNVGDGLRLGLAAGGTVVNENAGVLMETPNFSRVVDAFTPPWLVFVNLRGHRFVNEMGYYGILGNAIGAQPGGRCFALFDAAALTLATEDPAFTDPYGLGVDLTSNWTSEVLAAQIAVGRVHRADTLRGLAEAAGIAPDGLEATVEAWNADVERGLDAVFEKAPTMLLPIATPPFHAVELRPAVIGMTFTGLRIDDRARVLDAAGRPVRDLYAAGELTGGLMGWIYPAGGTSIGNALVFGRIAGREAAGG